MIKKNKDDKMIRVIYDKILINKKDKEKPKKIENKIVINEKVLRSVTR